MRHSTMIDHAPHLLCLFIGVWVIAYGLWFLAYAASGYANQKPYLNFDWIIIPAILATFTSTAILVIRFSIYLCFAGS